VPQGLKAPGTLHSNDFALSGFVVMLVCLLMFFLSVAWGFDQVGVQLWCCYELVFSCGVVSEFPILLFSGIGFYIGGMHWIGWIGLVVYLS